MLHKHLVRLAFAATLLAGLKQGYVHCIFIFRTVLVYFCVSPSVL